MILFLPYSDNLYLTEIDDEDSSCDCYFPSFDKSLYDKTIIREGESLLILSIYLFVIVER